MTTITFDHKAMVGLASLGTAMSSKDANLPLLGKVLLEGRHAFATDRYAAGDMLLPEGMEVPGRWLVPAATLKALAASKGKVCFDSEAGTFTACNGGATFPAEDDSPTEKKMVNGETYWVGNQYPPVERLIVDKPGDGRVETWGMTPEMLARFAKLRSPFTGKAFGAFTMHAPGATDGRTGAMLVESVEQSDGVSVVRVAAMTCKTNK